MPYLIFQNIYLFGSFWFILQILKIRKGNVSFEIPGEFRQLKWPESVYFKALVLKSFFGNSGLEMCEILVMIFDAHDLPSEKYLLC